MNRTIKFRVWDGNQMLYENQQYGLSPQYQINDDAWTRFWEAKNRLIEKYHLMQFTGVIDRHGKGMYEGDIVKVALPDYDEIHTYAIAWHQGFCCFGYLNLEFVDIINYAGDAIVDQFNYQHIIEVIGNIYENPELVNL